MDERWFGYGALVLGCVGFSLNIVPVRMINVHDGFFFGLVRCFGILAVAFFYALWRGRLACEPLALFGGAVWATGNVCYPVLVQYIGLGLGMFVVGVAGMLAGWASGFFGILGKPGETLKSPMLNYAGVGLVVLSLLCLKMIHRSPPPASSSGDSASDPSSELPTERSDAVELACGARSVEDGRAASGKGERQGERRSSSRCAAPEEEGAGAPPPLLSSKLALGCAMAVFSGATMAVAINPLAYLADEANKAKSRGEVPENSTLISDYLFAHYLGAFFVMGAFFAVYLAAAPEVFCGKEVFLPGLCSGLVRGLSNIPVYRAFDYLDNVVIFPVISAVPGLVAVFLGIWLLGEHRERRDCAWVLGSCGLQGLGIAFVFFSKEK